MRLYDSTVPWRPLITDGLRATIERVIRELVDTLATTPGHGARSPGDHADRALARTYLMQDDLVSDPGDAARDAIVAAIDGIAKAGPSLYGGAPGIGWTVTHVVGGEAADRVCGAIDRALARRVDGNQAEDYDLVRGLVGIGVYALERGNATLAVDVLDRLERTALPRLGGLAWHTGPEVLPPWQLAQAPVGYWNLGLAHGIPGIIGLLARYLVHEIEPERTRRLLDGAVAFMLALEPPSPTGRYTSWHLGPADAPSVRDGTPNGRLAWCYGDFGVAFALLAAAQATGRADWRAEALALAADCAARSRPPTRANDTGLCHGAFGLAHMFNRLRHATGDDRYADAARYWIEHGLAIRSDKPLAGFPSLETHDGVDVWVAEAGLLTGIAGAALVLHAAISTQEPAWDRVMLLDLAEA